MQTLLENLFSIL